MAEIAERFTGRLLVRPEDREDRTQIKGGPEAINHVLDDGPFRHLNGGGDS